MYNCANPFQNLQLTISETEVPVIEVAQSSLAADTLNRTRWNRLNFWSYLPLTWLHNLFFFLGLTPLLPGKCVCQYTLVSYLNTYRNTDKFRESVFSISIGASAECWTGQNKDKKHVYSASILTPWLMEPGGSMPHSRGLSNNSYPEPNRPNFPHWYLFLQGPF